MSKIFLASLLGGAALLIGAGSSAHAAPVLQPMAGVQAVDHNGAVQPVYWTRDRWGRRIWIEERRPPPRRGWVDRWGRWHPY